MIESVKRLQRIGGLKTRLTKSDQFDRAFSELQIVSCFAKLGSNGDIEPPLGTKSLDLEVSLDGKRILFEVKGPTLFRKLKYSGGGFIPNRARGKIYEEFVQHLSEVSRTETRPIVIVLNIGRSEIDYDFIADYLYGSLQFTWLVDKKTGKVADQGWTRAKDSLHEKGENLQELGPDIAVVCYKTIFGSDAKFHLQGTMFLNPTAQNPPTETQSDMISKALFGV